MENPTNTNNGVTLSFIPGTIVKGTSAGNPILRPELNKLSREERFAYVGGMDAVDKLISKVINAQAAMASREAFDENTGHIDMEDWAKLISGASVGSDTRDQLEEAKDALLEEQAGLLEELQLADTDESRNAIFAKASRIKQEIIAIKAAIAEKDAVSRKRIEARNANKAKATATAAA